MIERAGLVLRILCLIVVLIQGSLVLRGPVRMLDRPLTEDGYYSLTVARNIAEGRGITSDGVRWTNGFQPLFTFLCVPLFRFSGGDPIWPLRMLLLLHLIIHVATAALLAGIAHAVYRDSTSLDRTLEPNGERAFGWLVAFLYLVAVGTFLQHYNGLETGLSLFLVVAAWWVYLKGAGETMANALSLGLVLGLAILARIDAAILVGVVCVGELLRRDFDRVDAVRRSLIIGAIAVCVSSPWWLYNVIMFGSLMPTSGAAQQSFLLSAERIERAVSAWFADAVPWIYARRGGGLIEDFVRLVVLIPALRGLPHLRRGEDWSLSTVTLERTRRFALYLVVFVGVLAVWYCVSSWASHFYVRYLAALIPCATLVIAFAAWRFTRNSGALAAALAITLVGFMGFVIVALHQGRVFGQNHYYSDQLALIRSGVPASEWVAAAQTGTLGYFRDHVLNLDGKVNPEAYAARKDIPGYLDRTGIRWFCDEPWFIQYWFGMHPEARGWRLVGDRGNFVLYHNEPS